MMPNTRLERLYELLPAVYRLRDAERGETLRALMAVFENVYTSVEADVAAMYDDWFVETCHEDVVPLLGDLVGAERLLDPDHMHGTRRRGVANTATYRLRTGTLPTIESIARDLTGWHVLAVDVSRRVAANQHLQHQRLSQGRTVDLHDRASLEWAGTALDTLSHAVDVHGVSPQVGNGGYRTGGVQGRYNLPNLAIYFWRLQSYSLLGTTPFHLQPGCYTFDPRGQDVPLFAEGRTASHDLAPQWVNYPGPLRRGPLGDELEERRRSIARGEPILPPNAAPDRLSFDVFVGDRLLPPERIVVRDLAEWSPPPERLYYDGPRGERVAQEIDAAVDPERGRITCRAGISLGQVSFTYGFSGPVGGGAYNRQESVDRRRARPVTWQAVVRQSVRAESAYVFETLDEAVRAWNATPAGTAGCIAIADNRTYAGSRSVRLDIKPASQLTLVAASCPALDAGDGSPGSGGSSAPAPTDLRLKAGRGLEVGEYRYQVTFLFGSFAAPLETGGGTETDPIRTRAGLQQVDLDIPTGPAGTIARNLYRTLVDGPSGSERFVATIEGNLPRRYPDAVSDRDLEGNVPRPAEVVGNGLRPCVRGLVEVRGAAPADATDPGELLINGLLVDGPLRVVDGNLGGLEITHATLAPDRGGLSVESGNGLLAVKMESSICGPVALSADVPVLRLEQSIVDGAGAPAIVARGTSVVVEASTILGGGRMHSLGAANSIFTGVLQVERSQAGGLRACYIPDESITPPRYRCQPDQALEGVVGSAARAWIRGHVAPTFNSLAYGQPGYAQLAPSTAIEIRTGASGEREMGAFFPLHQPLRMAHFLDVLNQHLPLGREVGVFFVT